MIYFWNNIKYISKENFIGFLGEERRSVDLELVNLIVILTYGTASLSFLLYLPPNNTKIPLQEFINRTLVHHHWDSALYWQYPYIKESGFLVLSAVTSPSKCCLLIFMNFNKSLREKWWKKGRYNYWSNQMCQSRVFISYWSHIVYLEITEPV